MARGTGLLPGRWAGTAGQRPTGGTNRAVGPGRGSLVRQTAWFSREVRRAPPRLLAGPVIVRHVAPSWYDPYDMPDRKAPLPALGSPHLRHPGLYEPLCRAYADAAAICFSESHTSPVEIEIRHEDSTCLRELAWDEPSGDAWASWRNSHEATEQGACSVGLATVEAELGLVALSRAETRTGADFYIALPGQRLEEAHRLEISGTKTGMLRDLHSRLRQKVRQTRRGLSSQPALACVVGFRVKMVALASLEMQEGDA